MATVRSKVLRLRAGQREPLRDPRNDGNGALCRIREGNCRRTLLLRLQHAELILGNNVDQTEPLLQPLDDLALALVDARDPSLNPPPELPHRLDLLLRPVDPSPPRRSAVRDPQRARDEFRHPRLALMREEEVGAVEDRGEPVECDDLVPVDDETLLVVLSLARLIMG